MQVCRPRLPHQYQHHRLYTRWTMPKEPYYAVRVGRKPGIYRSWKDCKDQVDGFKGSQHKRFNTEGEAEEYRRSGPHSTARSGPLSFSSTSPSSWSRPSLSAATAASPPKYKPPSIDEMVSTFRSNIRSTGPSTLLANVEDLKHSRSTSTSAATASSASTDASRPNEQPRAYPPPVALPQRNTSSGSMSSSSSYSPPATLRTSTWPIVATAPPAVAAASSTSTRLFTKGKAGHIAPTVPGQQVVYTDGSGLNNGRADCQAGIGIWLGPGDPKNVSSPLVLHDAADKPSNQKAEIQAVTVALQKADPTKPLKILTDSQYVVNSVTDWIKNWRKRDYDQVQNSAYFKDLDREFHKRTGETEIAYVKAHDGLAGNEAADILAKDGAARYVRK